VEYLKAVFQLQRSLAVTAVCKIKWICVCVSMCVRVSLSVFVFLCAPVSMCVSASVSLCLCVSMCLYVYVCVCVPGCVCRLCWSCVLGMFAALHRQAGQLEFTVSLPSIWAVRMGFWNVTKCRPLEVHCQFGGAYCLHLQGRRVRKTIRKKQRES
jgi:hypothetical protein